MVDAVKRKLNKDTMGALGAGGGAGFLIAWSSDIHTLFGAFYQHLGLTGEPLLSATEISTDAIIIIGSAVVSFIASKFSKQ